MHYEKARVDDALAYDRNVVEHVLGLLETCRCIDVPSELGTDALEPLEKRLAREVFRSVEAHVLEEMCETVLVVALLICSDVSREVEFSPLCRLVIVADVIGHAVLQLSYPYFRVIGERCLAEGNRSGEDRRNENKQTLHSIKIGLYFLITTLDAHSCYILQI